MKNKNEIIVLSSIFFLCILNCIWILSLDVYPFIDLPFRIAESTILKNINDNTLLFSKFYDLPHLIRPNILYTVFCAYLFPDAETGNKIYFVLYIFLLPLSVYYLLRKLKLHTEYSLLSFLLLINHNVHWGFTGYMMSIPLIIISLIIFFEIFVNRKNLYIYFLPLLFLISFFLHFQTSLFLILIFVSYNIYYNRNKLVKIFLYFISIIPAFTIMIITYRYDSNGSNEGLMNYLFKYYTVNWLFTLPERIKVLFITDNFFFFSNDFGGFYALLISVFILLIFVLSLKKIKEFRAQNKNIFNFLLIIFSVTLLCFIFLPNNIPGQNIIYERFTVILLLLLIILSAHSDLKLPLKAFIIIVALTYNIIVIQYMFDFKSSSAGFTESIFPDSQNKTLAGFISDNDFRGRKVYAHYPMYYTIWKKGITTGLVDYRFGLFKRKLKEKVFPSNKEWDTGFNPGEYYNTLNYILVKSPEVIDIKNFKVQKQNPAWILYENENLK